MQKSCFKVFFSKLKERAWLNKMGSSGYRLVKISDSKYTFEHSEEHKYYYSVEYFDYSPQSDAAIEYYESRKEEGIQPVIIAGNWVYFLREDAEIEADPEVYKNNAVFYLTRTLYLFFFSLVGCLINGYQFYCIGYLDKVGHLSDATVISPKEIENAKSLLDKVLNSAKGLLNLMIGWANRYFKIWFDIFGENDAIAVISVVLPITVVLIIIACFNFDEYLKHKKLSKKKQSDEPCTEPIKKESVDAE